MYSGSHLINMDAKGRLAIPAKVREDLQADCGGQIVVTADTEEPCLVIFPKHAWDQLSKRMAGWPSSYKKVARMKRLLLGYATPLEVDSENGRVLLPPTLREYAGLEKRLMLIGQPDKLELWSEDGWNAYLKREDADDVPAELLPDLSY